VISELSGTGQPLLHRVVEGKPALGDQLHDQCGDVGLGHAGDAEPVLRRDRARTSKVRYPDRSLEHHLDVLGDQPEQPGP